MLCRDGSGHQAGKFHPRLLSLHTRGSMVSMMSSAKEKNPPADNEMHLDAGTSENAKKIKGWDFHDHEA
jgi:hypothetical protein